MSEIFSVTGMTCGHCEASVKRAIQRLDSSAKVSVDRKAERVEVTGSTQPRAALAAAIREEGYLVAEG